MTIMYMVLCADILSASSVHCISCSCVLSLSFLLVACCAHAGGKTDLHQVSPAVVLLDRPVVRTNYG